MPRADHHAIRFDGPLTNLHESPVIGNGDLAAMVQVFHDEFRLHLGKNDLFDARFDYDAKASIFTQENLIRASRDYGFRLEGGNYEFKPVYDRTPPAELAYPDDRQAWDRDVHPCPKYAGWIRVLHSGISSTRIDTRIDLARMSVRSVFQFDYDWHGWGRLIIEAFIERHANVVRMRISTQGQVGDFHLCIERPPDALDPTIPPAVVCVSGPGRGVVSQTIPAGFDMPEFSWHMAGAFPISETGIPARPLQAQVRRLLQVCNVAPGKTLEWAVGVATDRDGPAPSVERAAALVADKPAEIHADRSAKQENDWAKFWSAAEIELEDKDLEATWYRNLAALACHIKPGAHAPGLCANVVPYDSSPWHGVYTVNMNIQKMFLAGPPTNHPEWIECYAGWLDEMLPSFEFFARHTFGLEGIHSPHMLLPYVPPHRQFNSNTCGRALGMTGWHAQPLWWHWETTRDVRFLRERTYPYLRRAASFYCRYLEKFMDESGDLYPSLILEHPPWTKNLERNRDCFTDLILFRHTFEWAIEAAEVLGVDAQWRERWAAALTRIRPVRHETLPIGAGWIATDKNAPRPVELDFYRDRRNSLLAMAAAWSIFPGEYADGDEVEGFAATARDIMTRMQWHTLHPDVTWIHHWWCCIPALRMRLPGAFEVSRRIILQERFPAGHARTTHWINLQPSAWRCPEDNYLGVAATTEMLLQSQSRVLRLFPNWPREKWARFRGLPARGGFRVDASIERDGTLRATVSSIAGGPCRLRWERAALPTVMRGGRVVDVTRDGRDLIVATTPGDSFCVGGVL